LSTYFFTSASVRSSANRKSAPWAVGFTVPPKSSANVEEQRDQISKERRKKEEEEELAPFRLCPFNGCRKPSGMSFKNLQHFTKLNNMMTPSRHVALRAVSSNCSRRCGKRVAQKSALHKIREKKKKNKREKKSKRKEKKRKRREKNIGTLLPAIAVVSKSLEGESKEKIKSKIKK